MTIGVLEFTLYFPGSTSLKAKRMVLHSLKSRVRNSFNVALSQVADEDKWQKATMACVGVERSRSNVNSTLSRVVDFIGTFPGVHLIEYGIELL